MATDALLERQGVLAKLSDTTIQKLNNKLPAAWSHGNPIDVLGDAPPERFASAIEITLADPAVDGLLVVLSPQAMTDPTGAAKSVIQAVERSSRSAARGRHRTAHVGNTERTRTDCRC
jgi:acetyltransferase